MTVINQYITTVIAAADLHMQAICAFHMHTCTHPHYMRPHARSGLRPLQELRKCIYKYIHLYIYMYVHKRRDVAVRQLSADEIFENTYIYIYMYVYVHKLLIMIYIRTSDFTVVQSTPLIIA